MYQIQPSNAAERHQLSPIYNNTSVTTNIHRMVIPSLYVFVYKRMKNDERDATLF